MSQRRTGPRPRWALVAIPIAWIVAVSVIDVLAPPDIHLGPLLVAAPAITPSFGGPRTVGLVAALAVVAQTLIGVIRDPDDLLSANHEAQIIALILVGTSLVVFCVLRERRAEELTQVRYVSEVAQRVVLPPLPGKLGPLRASALYLAAEARIGGDLYAAARTTSGTRLIVGDVQGKGMTAVNDAALLLGAFRVAAHREAALDELMTYLDRSVCWDLTEPGETSRYGETFITATVMDIPDRNGPVRMISCGHPPPVILHDGRPTTIDVRRPAPPLGLGELTSPGTTSTASRSSRETSCWCTRTASPRPATPPAPSTRSPTASPAGARATPTPSSPASGTTCCATSAAT